jgi:hypothetical protein
MVQSAEKKIPSHGYVCKKYLYNTSTREKESMWIFRKHASNEVKTLKGNILRNVCFLLLNFKELLRAVRHVAVRENKNSFPIAVQCQNLKASITTILIINSFSA